MANRKKVTLDTDITDNENQEKETVDMVAEAEPMESELDFLTRIDAVQTRGTFHSPINAMIKERIAKIKS
jgi:hypothetical protein